jgi:hypothetical protein
MFGLVWTGGTMGVTCRSSFLIKVNAGKSRLATTLLTCGEARAVDDGSVACFEEPSREVAHKKLRSRPTFEP